MQSELFVWKVWWQSWKIRKIFAMTHEGSLLLDLLWNGIQIHFEVYDLGLDAKTFLVVFFKETIINGLQREKTRNGFYPLHFRTLEESPSERRFFFLSLSLATFLHLPYAIRLSCITRPHLVPRANNSSYRWIFIRY